MMNRLRGAFAALFLASLVSGPAALPASAARTELAPGETVLANGMTTEVRHATASGAVAIEVWIRCPADGWTGAQPGIARLTAFAAVGAKSGGSSLRDLVRVSGGQLNVSVFQTASEIAVLAPANAAVALQDELVRRVFHASLDAASFDEARTRLAEEQAAAAQSTPEILRDQVFANLFSSGPMHDSTFGDSRSLGAATLSDVRGFAARSYVGANAAVVSLGNGDASDLSARLAASAASASSSGPGSIPASSVAKAPASPISVASSIADVPGVALAWTGPPIADQRAATAMDFLSDYLADQHAGAFAHAVAGISADASIAGQFVTLENQGVFFVSVTGANVDPSGMAKVLRDALAPVLARPLGRNEFAQALGAYETRLLRQMDSPQGLADNYGWYFAQDAPAYAPSATDASLGGRYFQNASSLTADYVHDVARQYLGIAPVVVDVAPNRPPVKISPGGT